MNIVICTGNSDNKLTQKEWSEFVAEMSHCLNTRFACHFHGCSEGSKPWQNAAWLLETISVSDSEYLKDMQYLRLELERLGKKFKQDSIFMLQGVGEFVK